MMTALELVGVLLRWFHIASAALLVGGLAYARAVATPACERLPDGERVEIWERLSLRFRPMVYAAVAGLMVSGVYNYIAHPGHTRYYHAWFGVKMLFAAHVFAASILATGSDNAKRVRRLTGAAISGLFVILLAAYLRRIF